MFKIKSFRLYPSQDWKLLMVLGPIVALLGLFGTGFLCTYIQYMGHHDVLSFVWRHFP